MHVTTALEQELRSHAQAGALLGAGTLLWVIATLVLRLFGAQLLPTGRPVLVGGAFAISVLVAILVVLSVFSLLDVPPERRLAATVLLVVPGMLLEGAITASVLAVSAAPDSLLSSANSGLLLWLYAVVLLTGIAPLVKPIIEEDAETEDDQSRESSTQLDTEGRIGTGED